MERILLCTDLDRTIIPNGAQPESPRARELLRRLSENPLLTLAYVSGRNRALLEDAIGRYELPVPDYAVGDVGTCMYRLEKDASGAVRWELLQQWFDDISRSWPEREPGSAAAEDPLLAVFSDVDGLRLQDPEHQSRFKLSFFLPLALDFAAIRADLEDRCRRLGFDAALVYSVDEAENVGLLDVIPARATKLHAVQFLGKLLGVSKDHTVFCGDSGNDLEALAGGLNAVLVANASVEVREEACALVAKRGLTKRFYCARGGFLELNGNYSAGVLEGVHHFFPELFADRDYFPELFADENG